MNKVIAVVLIVLGITPSAFSQFRLQQPAYGGSACPAGSASVVFYDGLIKVLLDHFPSESEGKLFKVQCTIRFPVSVENGFQVRQVMMNAKGFVQLPTARKGKLEFKLFSSTNGSSPLKLIKSFTGPILQNFELVNDLMVREQTWSTCGASSIFLVAEISAEISAAKQPDESFLSLDDLDFQIQWRRCK